MKHLLYVNSPKYDQIRWDLVAKVNFIAHLNGVKTYWGKMKEIQPPYNFLDGVNGVVLVGPQTSRKKPESAMFENHKEYFNFLRNIHSYGLKVVAVSPVEGMLLPGNNAMIDDIFVHRRGMDSIDCVASSIIEFFSLLKLNSDELKTNL